MVISINIVSQSIGLKQAGYSLSDLLMNVLIISPISIRCKRAGGAEIYLYDIINCVKDQKTLVLTSYNETGVYRDSNYLEYAITQHEFFFPIALIKFIRFFRSYDIIIENISKFPTVWPLILSKLLLKPLIVIVHHIHGKTLFKELPPIIALLMYVYEKLSLKLYSLFVTHVIVVSESTKEELIKLGFPEHKISVIHPAYNPRLGMCCSSALDKEPLLVVYVGRVKKYKRLEHLVKAIEIVRQRIPSVKCIIAGKGDKEVYMKLRDIIKKSGLESSITIIGEVSEKEKCELLRRASVFVNPSMKEGFSISTLEAQACGTPVVGYEIPGLVNCVKNNVTGLLVTDGDYRELAKAILRILMDEKLRLEMSKNAMMWAQSFYWDLSSKKLSDLLARLSRRR